MATLMAMAAIGQGVASAAPPPGLPAKATDMQMRFAPAHDYDGNGCYPTPAVGPDGQINGGLKNAGALHGECRDLSDLQSANEYVRTKCNNGWCAIAYALYFEKDQAVKSTDHFGHRHDWEHIVVWVEQASNDVQFVAVSTHKRLDVKPRDQVPFLDGTHPKVVYHKDGASTHAYRFAKAAETPENAIGDWHFPALVDHQDGFPSPTVRDALYGADFGKKVNFDLKDSRFGTLLEKAKPKGIPFEPNAQE